jgi:uncharacterized protein (TIGR02996 family)
VRAVDEEAGFIAAMLAEPDDRTVLLVYADWLDEHSDPRGEYLRMILEGSFAGDRLPRFIEISVGIDYQWRERIATRHWRVGDAVHITEAYTREARIVAIAPDRSLATVEVRRTEGEDDVERVEYPLGILQRPAK